MKAGTPAQNGERLGHADTSMLMRMDPNPSATDWGLIADLSALNLPEIPPEPPTEPCLAVRRRSRPALRAKALTFGAGVLTGMVALGAALALLWGDRYEGPALARQAGIEQGVPSLRTAKVSVRTSPPGMPVHINGEALGASPLLEVGVPSGVVRVRVDRPGRRPWVKTVRLSATEHRTLRVHLPSAVLAAR